MDTQFFIDAGYDLGGEHYQKMLAELLWDDNFRILKIGENLKEGDEMLGCSGNWVDYPNLSEKLKPADCIYRRLKDGLTKAKVKEE